MFKAIACLVEVLNETLRFFDFPYRIWASIRTTNIIERVFREFRRRTKVMDTFPSRGILYPYYVLLSSNDQ